MEIIQRVAVPLYRANYNGRADRRCRVAKISMGEFTGLVRGIMETLPGEIKRFLENVVVEVEDWPDDDWLRRNEFTEEEIEEGAAPLGFFEPFPLPEVWSGESVDTSAIVNRLWIFKGPHEEEFPDPKRLRTEIRKTVIHELA